MVIKLNEDIVQAITVINILDDIHKLLKDIINARPLPASDKFILGCYHETDSKNSYSPASGRRQDGAL